MKRKLVSDWSLPKETKLMSPRDLLKRVRQRPFAPFRMVVSEDGMVNDYLTAAALGLLAMCLVTVAHEAVGHSGTCPLLDGHIVLLTSFTSKERLGIKIVL